MTKKTPLEKLIRWRDLMNLRLPIIGDQAHFSSRDIRELDEIIESIKSDSKRKES